MATIQNRNNLLRFNFGSLFMLISIIVIFFGGVSNVSANAANKHDVKVGSNCKILSDCGYNEACLIGECVVDVFKWDKEHDQQKLRWRINEALVIGLPILGVVVISLIICCCCSCCPLYKCCCCCCGKKKENKEPPTQSFVSQANLAYDQEGNPLLVQSRQPAYGSTSNKEQVEQPQFQDQYQYPDYQVPPPPPPTAGQGQGKGQGWVPASTPLPPPNQYQAQYPPAGPPYPYPNVNIPQPQPQPPPFHQSPPPPYFEIPTAPPHHNNNEDGTTQN